MKKSQWIPWVYGSGATLFLSLTGIFIAALNQFHSMDALVLAFWRNFLVVLFLLGLLIFRRELKAPGHWRFFLFFGLVQCCFNLLWTYSVFLNGAAVSTLLVYSSVIFTPFLEAIIFRKKLSPALIIVLPLCLWGCYFISGLNGQTVGLNHWLGILVGLASGLAYGCFTILGKGAMKRGYNARQSLFYSFSSAALFMLVLLGFRGDLISIVSIPSIPAWMLLLGLALGPTFLGFLFYQKSLEKLSCTTVNLMVSFEPILTAVFAWIFLREPLTNTQLWGALLVFGSIVLWSLLEGRPIQRQKKRVAA